MRKRYTRVCIHYIGTLADGTVFDDNRNHAPFEVLLGSTSIPPGLEKALYEMEKGEERTLHVMGDDAFGEYRQEGVLKIPLYEIPNGDTLPIGQYIRWSYKNAPHPTYAKVLDVSDMFVTLDLNHPLAGQELTYWVKIEDEDDEVRLPKEISQLFNIGEGA